MLIICRNFPQNSQCGGRPSRGDTHMKPAPEANGRRAPPAAAGSGGTRTAVRCALLAARPPRGSAWRERGSEQDQSPGQRPQAVLHPRAQLLHQIHLISETTEIKKKYELNFAFSQLLKDMKFRFQPMPKGCSILDTWVPLLPPC